MSDVSERVSDERLAQMLESAKRIEIAEWVSVFSELQSLRSSTLAADRAVDDKIAQLQLALVAWVNVAEMLADEPGMEAHFHDVADATLDVVIDARAALSPNGESAALRAVQPSIAGGPDWVMVPREPTEAMLEAPIGERFPHLTDAHLQVLRDGFAAKYRAMIDAAPARSSKDNGDGK